MNNYKAVIFDLDGTLLDTLDDLADSMNAVLCRLNCPPHKKDAYKYFVGDGLHTLARRVLPADQQKQVEHCAKEMLKEYSKRWADKTSLYAGIDQLLNGLLEKEFKLAILSNKPDAYTQKTAQKFLNSWPFSIILGARDHVPKKPDPAGAIEIARTLNLPPAQCLYMGDTNTDMETASAAGMFSIGVLWGFRKEKELQDSGAQLILKHPTELIDHLQTI